MLVAADIGATNARFACFDKPELKRRRIYQSKSFSGVCELIEKYLSDLKLTPGADDVLCLAIPGPVGEEYSLLTNLEWRISPGELKAGLGFGRVKIINDFAAAALTALEVDSICLYGDGDSPDSGDYVVTGAGSGLGTAFVCNGKIHDSEGGHMLFAPQDKRQYELAIFLAAKYGKIQYEHVLSGQGLGDIYKFLTGEDISPEKINLLTEDGNANAIKTVRIFTSVLADFIGNLAFVFKPGAGIYIAGGVCMKLKKHIRGNFSYNYIDRGKLSEVVKAIPVYLLEDENAGLKGAVIAGSNDLLF